MLTKVTRPTIDDLALSPGKRARLHRMLYEYGPGNGTLLFLPIDQGIEHGPVDFFDNPDSIDPDYEYRLALEGNYSGIALHYGLAAKYFSSCAVFASSSSGTATYSGMTAPYMTTGLVLYLATNPKVAFPVKVGSGV